MVKIRYYIILFIFSCLLSYLFQKGIINSQAKNRTLSEGLGIIKNFTKLEEVDIGEYKKIKIKKLFPFYTTAYNIGDVGFISILSANFGLFQVFSFHLSPYKKDFPILIIDYMYIFGKRKIIFEAYNTTIDNNSSFLINFIKEFERIKAINSDILDWKIAPKWGDERVVINMKKEGNSSLDKRFISLFSDVIYIYMKNIVKMTTLEGELKTKKASLIKEFSEQLAKKGGIAGKIFKSEMNEEDVVKLFVEIFFGLKFQ
jgi:hypothetical protein